MFLLIRLYVILIYCSANFAAIEIIFPTIHEDVIVLSIGSITRRDVQLAQGQTFGRKSFIIPFDETYFPNCTICEYNSTFYRKSKEYSSRNYEWRCAQHRFLQAISIFLHGNTMTFDWLMVVDDDTFVYMNRMKRFLKSNSSSPLLPQIYGNDQKGGAGFIFNYAATQGLLAGFTIDHIHISQNTDSTAGKASLMEQEHRSFVDICIQRMLGLDWCFLNSDWAIAECVKMAGLPLLKDVPCMLQNHLMKTCPSMSRVLTRHRLSQKSMRHADEQDE